MTSQVRSVNKAKFENGDKPQGSDYVDLIDSFLSLADTSAQSVTSHVTFSGGLATTTASAATVVADLVQAATVAATQVDTTVLTATSATATKIEATTVSGATVNGAAGTITALTATSAAVTLLDVTTVRASAVTLYVETTAAASGGAGGAVPTSADGFLTVTVGANVRYIPYFKVK